MNEEIDSHVLKKYKVLKKIGSGAYGIVWKVMDRSDKKIKALKKNFDAFHNSTDAQRTYRQIMFLLQLTHPNIIVLEQVIHAENDKDIYLVFEHMDIDLYNLIRENILGEKHKKFILYQTCKAIFYMHSAGLIHRDIKPSNILANESCEAKICDFGLVRSVDDEHDDKEEILTQYIATRWYRAPQILLGSRNYCKPIDIWSVGCMIGQMVKGKPMFPGTSTINQLERVLLWTGPPNRKDMESLNTKFGKQTYDLLTKVKKSSKKQWFSSISPDCLDLISKTLQFNPEKRITIQQVLQHPYLSEFYNQDQIITSTKKVKIPIDDNDRLSLKDYRIKIYQMIKQRTKNSFTQTTIMNGSIYRIREKHSKPKTEISESKGKDGRKSSIGSVKKNPVSSSEEKLLPEPVKKKSLPAKPTSVNSKKLKTLQKEWNPVQTRKMLLLRGQSNNSWLKDKKSISQVQTRKQVVKPYPTIVDFKRGSFY